VSDAMQAALDPMLAVSKGRLIEMSSPNGKRGHFYENWQHAVVRRADQDHWPGVSADRHRVPRQNAPEARAHDVRARI
jgi:hypothetical protein